MQCNRAHRAAIALRRSAAPGFHGIERGCVEPGKAAAVGDTGRIDMTVLIKFDAHHGSARLPQSTRCQRIVGGGALETGCREFAAEDVELLAHHLFGIIATHATG